MMNSNERAPDFSLMDIHGEGHCLSDYLGEIVILNFWSAECPQSERADAVMQAFFSDLNRKVTVLTIASNVNDDLNQIQKIVAERDLDTVLHDPDHQVADAYNAKTTPHLFLVDGQGMLRYQGAFDDVNFRQRTPTHNYLFSALRAVWNGQEPEPDQTQPYGCTIIRHQLDSC